MNVKKTLFKCVRIVGRIFYKRRIWLVSDRSSMAGDNGEAFFRFLKQKGVDAVFAINSDSDDYERIAGEGEVVDYDSLRHKFLLCVSECYCSSHLIHMENHEETPQIFLGHGLAEKNISKMLNVASHKNFYIVTAAPFEHDQMCGEDYTIDPTHVWLTGFPRFDLLHNAPKKKIVIALTWRTYLSGLSKEEIQKSDYYKMIVRLMESNQLFEIISNYGYELYIKLHPEMHSLAEFLPETGKCSLYADSYNKMYEEASVMITDYSSTIYDFAYMHKPVIYFQFDGGGYYKDNPFISAGGFDYEKDGLGPVTITVEELCSKLEQVLRNGCEMEEEYSQRLDTFFAYHDDNNSERIYQKIIEILR